MSSPFAIIVGFLLGLVGGAGHLAITYLRTRMLTHAPVALMLVTFPMSLVPPLAMVLIAAQLTKSAAWASVFGLLLAHGFFFLRLTRRP